METYQRPAWMKGIQALYFNNGVNDVPFCQMLERVLKWAGYGKSRLARLKGHTDRIWEMKWWYYGGQCPEAWVYRSHKTAERKLVNDWLYYVAADILIRLYKDGNENKEYSRRDSFTEEEVAESITNAVARGFHMGFVAALWEQRQLKEEILHPATDGERVQIPTALLRAFEGEEDWNLTAD